MEIRNALRNRLQEYGLSFTWLIGILRLRGLEVDKTTLSSAFGGTITGPRVERIMENTEAVLNAYEVFVQSITV